MPRTRFEQPENAFDGYRQVIAHLLLQVPDSSPTWDVMTSVIMGVFRVYSTILFGVWACCCVVYGSIGFENKFSENWIKMAIKEAKRT